MHQNRSKGILSKWLSQWEDLFRQHRRFVIHGQENKVCRLIKSLNGLKQAPKQYHERFDTVMTAFEFKHYSVDRCIYSKCTYEYTISICRWYVGYLYSPRRWDEEIPIFDA